MLVVVDMGNTNITMGLFKDDQLIGNYRLTTKLQRTSDEYGFMILAFLSAYNVTVEDIKDVIISSVVPKIMYLLQIPFVNISTKNLLLLVQELKQAFL